MIERLFTQTKNLYNQDLSKKFLISSNWKTFIKDESNRNIAFGVFFFSIMVITAHYFHLLSLNTRPGVTLNDPILSNFGPYNFNVTIFSCTYFPIIAMIVYLLPRPPQFMTGLLCYAILLGMRMITMAITPLEPPASMIILKDPFLDWLLQNSDHLIVTKDLFFSGHTSTIFLFAFLVDNRILKPLFFTCSILVGTLITLQHVHYSVDTICAPVFAWSAYGLGTKIFAKCNSNAT